MAKRLLLMLAAVLLLYPLATRFLSQRQAQGNGEQVLAEAFREHRSAVQVQAEGRVIRILSDDNDGGRH